MADTHYVLIGNGPTGNRAAEVLRKGDSSARITVISSEGTHFILRHKLPPYITDGDELDSLRVHPPEWYDKRNINLRLNQSVVKVNPAEKWVLLAHREKVRYDKLLICTGARHRVPEYLSRFEKFLTRFCCTIDAIKLKKQLDDFNHITLLGGDCIGLLLVSALLPAGKKFTLIMDDYRFWPMEFDDTVKDRLAGALEKAGVEVISDDHVLEITRPEQRIEIATRGGKIIKTDMALLTSGMVPNLDYLGDSGIDMQDGVLVNEKLETNVADVWAAGEVAQIYYPELKDYRCSTGYVNAETQGEQAALNMLGGSERACLGEAGEVSIAGKNFTTYGWKGFSLDEDKSGT